MKLPEPVAWMVTAEMQDGSHSTFPLNGRYKDVRDTCDVGDPVPLYTEAQLRELFSKQEAVMHQALEVIELHPYPGWDHVWETKRALKRLLNKE